MTDKKAIKGGEFLIRETDPQDIFIPEEFDEEQQMIAQTCKDFLAQDCIQMWIELMKWKKA